MISDSLLNLKMMKLLINKKRVTVEAQIKQQTKHWDRKLGARASDDEEEETPDVGSASL